MKDIFISHSSKDIQYAREIYEKYEAKGYTCWASFDFESIKPGDEYTEKIPAAISSCKVFLLLVRMLEYYKSVDMRYMLNSNKFWICETEGFLRYSKYCSNVWLGKLPLS